MSNQDDEKLNRLWAYGLHEDNIFHDRLNLFLVFQSLLLGSVAVLGSTQNPNRLVLQMIITSGLVLTAIWALAQIKQAEKINIIKDRLLDADEDFRKTSKLLAPQRWPFPVTKLLAYGMPLLIALVWVALWFY